MASYMQWMAKLAPIAAEAEECLDKKEYAALIPILLKHFGAELGDIIANPASIDQFVSSVKNGNQKVLNYEQKLLDSGMLQRLVIRWSKLLNLDAVPRTDAGEVDIDAIEKALEGSGYCIAQKADAEIIDAEFKVKE